MLRLWRPNPLVRARRLEKLLDTPARIFYKYEGVSPAGSHKPNTAVPQAYYNHQEGVAKLTTETGARQWGSALAFSCAQYSIECEVWQVAASYRQKPHRKTMMEIWGATVHPSPSLVTGGGSNFAGLAFPFLREKLAGRIDPTILTALCGHCHLDLTAYEAYLEGIVIDLELSSEALAESMAGVPVLT